MAKTTMNTRLANRYPASFVPEAILWTAALSTPMPTSQSISAHRALTA